MPKELPKITLEQLMKMLANPSISEAQVGRYFIEDEAASGPMRPALRPNPLYVDGIVDLDGTRAEGLMTAANEYCRWRRKVALDARLAGGYNGPVLVAEGDSWFQYPLTLKDVIDWLSPKWAINCLSAAGAKLEDMVTTPEYAAPLARYRAPILLFSAGGNDLVAGGALADHLEPYDKDTAPQMRPEDYLRPSFQQILDNAFAHYERMCRDVAGGFPQVQIISHGYDYVVPKRGRWLGAPMELRGITDKTLQKQITTHMVDRFNNGLRRLAQRMPNLTYVDCRGSVAAWHDELHPGDAGYGKAAQRIDRAIAQAVQRAVVPVVVPGGIRGEERGGDGPSLQRGTNGRDRSLHIGLDFVNTQTYSGWDGRLFGCVSDSERMQIIAETQGYTARALHNQQATRDAVLAAMAVDAEQLVEGDHYLLTFACHGGLITDFNNDEDDQHDEALCLYDYMLADDEMFLELARFKPGVRILTVIDSCNSGTIVRKGMPDPFAPPTSVGLVRAMPRDVADRVNADHINDYKAHATRYQQIREDVVHGPMGPLRASLIHLAACQDDQSALEINGGGRFTRALGEVWANGAFTGDHPTFLNQIRDRLSGYQVPKYTTYGPDDAAFVAQIPFTLRSNPRGNPVVVAVEQSKGKTGVPVGARDPLPKEPAPAVSGFQTGGAGPGDPTALLAWLAALKLTHFAAEEFLAMGGPNAPDGSCAGLNTLPPPELWPNIEPTARVLDRLRGRLGRPVLIISAYRNPDYNACMGRGEDSAHLRFAAVDFMVQCQSPAVAGAELLQMRDIEGLFEGSVVVYDKYVHLDTALMM